MSPRLLASLLLLAVVSAGVLKTPISPADPSPSDLAEPPKESAQEERTPRLKRQYGYGGYGYGGYGYGGYGGYRRYGYGYPSYGYGSYNSYPSYNSYYSYPSYNSYYTPYSYYG